MNINSDSFWLPRSSVEPDYLIGIFLGVSGKKFAVEVDEREEAILDVYLEITVEAAVMQDVQASLRRLLREKRM